MSVQYDKVLSKFRQQQLIMVNYACGFYQSETGKYFETLEPKKFCYWGASHVQMSVAYIQYTHGQIVDNELTNQRAHFA